MNFFENLLYATPFIVIILIAVLYLGRKLLRWSNNNHSEIKTYEVTVIEKKEKYLILGASAATGLSNEASPRRYYLSCKTNDGKIIKCEVSYSTFDLIKEDSRGLLSMQGSRFIKFEKKKETEPNG